MISSTMPLQCQSTRLLVTLWFLATASHGRFNSESPSLIQRIAAHESGNTAVKKYGLDKLSHTSAVLGTDISFDLNTRGEKLLISEVAQILSYTEKNQIKSLAVKNCFLNSRDAELILTTALWKSDMKCLSMHNCRLNSVVLASTIKSSSATSEKNSVKDDRKSDAPISTAGKSEQFGVKSINDQLILLDVSFNNLDSISFECLSSIIKKCNKLEVLALDGNKMSCRDVQIIVDAVRSHPSLTHLSFSDCGLGDDHMEFLSFGLKMNRNISTLDLSSNKISPEGIQIFTDGLSGGGGRKIGVLDLSYNPLGDVGVQCVARAISLNHLSLLKELILKEVSASPISIEKLLHSFSHGSLLELLDLSGNILIPSNKQKKEKLGYSPKNLKKKLLSFTPRISDAMKSLTGVLSSQLQSASTVYETQKKLLSDITSSNKMKNYAPKGKKVLDKNKLKKSTSFLKKAAKRMDTKKINVKASPLLNTKNKKTVGGKGKILRKKIPLKNDVKIEIKTQVKKNSKIITKEIVLSEDQKISKLRLKVIRGLLHTFKMARNLKKIGLVKVGLNDFTCVLVKKEFNKQISDKKDTGGKVNLDNVSGSVENENRIKRIKKQMEKNKFNTSAPKIILSPQIIVPSEPELITNLDNKSYSTFSTSTSTSSSSFYSDKEKDIDDSIYKHLRPDKNIDNDALTDKDYDLAEDLIIDEIGDESKIFAVKNNRNLVLQTALNGLSQKSVDDLTEIAQLS